MYSVHSLIGLFCAQITRTNIFYTRFTLNLRIATFWNNLDIILLKVRINERREVVFVNANTFLLETHLRGNCLIASSNSIDAYVELSASFSSCSTPSSMYFSTSVRSLRNKVPSQFVIKSKDTCPVICKLDLLLLVPRKNVLISTVYS